VDQLLTFCPLDNIQSADVPAGCIAGIYNKYCTNANTLAECQRYYDIVFAASIFKSLGEVCRAWKNGPRSGECAKAISAFSYDYIVGDDNGVSVTVKVNKFHAQMLVANTLGNRVYAPCISSTCKW
jgi:hypothetical protein